MNEYTELILRELGETLPTVDENQLHTLVDEICIADRRIYVMGVGRVMISLKAWVKRLKHLAININYVGDETEMPLRPDDLLIVGSSSGESVLPKEIARIAKKLGGKIFYIGCSSHSTIACEADFHLIMKGRTKLKRPDEYQSSQPMSTLFEQQFYLLGDVVALMVMKKRNITEEDIKDCHANLE